MWRCILLGSLFCLTASCSPVQSSNFETSRLALDFEVITNVDTLETLFEIEVYTGRSALPVNLVRGDSLVIHHESQEYTANRISEGNYLVALPFISTGEYIVEIDRPNDISSNGTRVIMNNYPALITPLGGETYHRDDVFELSWEVQSNQGATLSAAYRLSVSMASCISELDETILSFNSEVNPTDLEIIDSAFPIPNDFLYSRQIRISDLLAELEKRNESGQPIKQCDISLSLSSDSSATLSPNNPNFEESSVTLPIVIFIDPLLFGGGGSRDVRSNKALITLINE